MSSQIVKVRGKWFAGRPAETVSCYVDDAGLVRAWDSVAGHYTICHSASAGLTRKVRAAVTGLDRSHAAVPSDLYR